MTQLTSNENSVMLRIPRVDPVRDFGVSSQAGKTSRYLLGNSLVLKSMVSHVVALCPLV